MSDLPFDAFALIDAHSAGLADLAQGRLDLSVPGCPGWTVADLVAHTTEVQWFWATIVEDRLAEPPGEDRRPARVADAELVQALRAQTARLVGVLRETDPRTPVWTWAPAQQDVAFITRHQVQEGAVHHWDAADAAGQSIVIERPAAVDGVEEFLTFSVSRDADLADPPRPPLAGRFVLRCTDGPEAWTISDGRTPGAARFDAGAAPGAPAIQGTASELLLWLYRRVRLDTNVIPPELIDRFVALTFTD